MNLFFCCLSVVLALQLVNADDRIISVDKYARQSSTHSSYHAQLAIDGRAYQLFSRGGCSKTQAGKGQWWEVDLTYDYRITGINIHNTANGGSELGEFRILVADDSKKFYTYKTQTEATQNGEVLTFFGEQFHVKYVRIQKLNDRPLTLCEVTIFGERNKGVDDYKEAAQNSYATQQTTVANRRAHLAVDGDLNQDISKFSCAHGKGFWQTDLTHYYSVDRVAIYTSIQKPKPGSAPKRFVLSVNDGKKWRNCAAISSSAIYRSRYIWVGSCGYKDARKVRISGNGEIVLCEVRVYGRRVFTKKEKNEKDD